MSLVLTHEVSHAELERDAQRLVRTHDEMRRAGREAQAQARETRVAAEAAAKAAAGLRLGFRRGGA